MVKRIKGFTLVEVMVSTVIVTMIIGAILGFFSHYLASVRRIEQHLIALKFANQTMEESCWDIAPISADDPIPPGAMGHALNPARTVTVANDNGNHYRIVTVTVGWQ